ELAVARSSRRDGQQMAALEERRDAGRTCADTGSELPPTRVNEAHPRRKIGRRPPDQRSAPRHASETESSRSRPVRRRRFDSPPRRRYKSRSVTMSSTRCPCDPRWEAQRSPAYGDQKGKENHEDRLSKGEPWPRVRHLVVRLWQRQRCRQVELACREGDQVHRSKRRDPGPRG